MGAKKKASGPPICNGGSSSSAAGPGLTDAQVLAMLSGTPWNDKELRAALLSKALDPNRKLLSHPTLDQLIWRTDQHDGFPLPVVAAHCNPRALQLVLAAGGDPNARTACGFNAVMAPLMNNSFGHEDRAAVLQVGHGSGTLVSAAWHIRIHYLLHV